MIDQAHKDHEIIKEIVRMLDQVEWRTDTLDDIAALLNNNGYKIRDLNDDEPVL